MEGKMKIVKKILLTLLISIMSLLFVFNSLSSQQTAGELFEKALYLEEAKGDLQKAIDLYQNILEQFPENREIAAKAQLHIGLCYEKLGLKEAPKAYQKVVDEYPEQKEAVKIAKEKLSVLSRAKTFVEKGDKEFKIRQVWADSIIGVARSGAVGAISPDGRYLTYVDWNSGDLAVQEMATGKKRHLTDKGSWNKSGAQAFCSRWSPNGNAIAYDCPQEGDSPNRDIYLLSIGGEHEIPVVNHPANDILLGWTPDGKSLLFASNRRGTVDAWLLRLEDGKPKETPELLMEGIGEIEPLGFTKNRSFYYSSSKSTQNVYMAKIDEVTAEIPTPPKGPIQHFGKVTHSPAYSPDGKYLAYISIRDSLGPKSSTQSVLCIRSLDTGEERELFPDLPDFWNLKWSPDSRYILSTAVDSKDRSAHSVLSLIDTRTGEVMPVVKCENNRLNQWFQSHDWSHDRKSIFYVRNNKPHKLCQLLVRDLESGKEKEIYRAPTWAERFTISLSPDGKWLALINYKGLEKKERSLKIIPATGGEPRVLHTFEQESNWPVFTAWTPDSKSILFSKKADKENDIKTDLWRIPVEGGEHQRLGLTMAQFNFLSVHPKGGNIVFSSFGPTLKESELWVMENLIPKKTKEK